MSEQLKPCPFCGAPGEVVRRFGNDHTPTRGVEVGCRTCRFRRTDKGVYKSLEDIETDAIAAWNTRADTRRKE